MHSISLNFHDPEKLSSIEFPAGEALEIKFQNPPDHGERVLTIGLDTGVDPLLEVSGGGRVLVTADRLTVLPEGKICKYNLWQRDAENLDLIAEGRLVRRTSLAPASFSTRLQANSDSPLLFIDGDSVMQNIPGTRVFLEQLLGHKYRFCDGYLGAVGGHSARAIYESAPEILSRIVPDRSVVLVGPVGANQTADDDDFKEITTYLDALFASYLSAGAKVVAVPTLLDGMGLTQQDEKKTALADWVQAYGSGGTVQYQDQTIAVSAHENFYSVSIEGFDRETMKSDVSHPNALGSRYLANAISSVLLGLVDHDVFSNEGVVNLLADQNRFIGSRVASAVGVQGAIPLHWEVNRTEGITDWHCGFDDQGCFEISVQNAASDSTLVITLPDVSVDAVVGDIINFITRTELLNGATGVRSIGVAGQGSSIMTLDPEWAIDPGVYNIRTRDEPYVEDRSAQDFQVFVRVAAGATANVKFIQAAAFHIETIAQSEVDPVVAEAAGWDVNVNTQSPLELTYSEDTRTVTATASISGLRHALGAEALEGRRYFETVIGPDVLGVGIGTGDVTAVSGGGFGVGRSFWSGNLFFHSGGNHAMGATLVDGDIVQIAVDVEAKLIWVRRNDAGDWNNDPLADPSAGLGGLAITDMVGDLYAYAGLQAVPGGEVILDFNATNQTFNAPLGFSASA